MSEVPFSKRVAFCRAAGVAPEYREACAETITGPNGAQCMSPQEWELFVLVNEDRQNASLPKLELDCRLALAARLHSRDMAAHNYLEHTSLDGREFDDRIEAVIDRIEAVVDRFFLMGENIGNGDREMTMPALEQAFMQSPDHRHAILNRDYTHLGVGCAQQGDKLWCTQDFGGQPQARAIQVLSR